MLVAICNKSKYDKCSYFDVQNTIFVTGWLSDCITLTPCDLRAEWEDEDEFQIFQIYNKTICLLCQIRSEGEETVDYRACSTV
jgi:hypothetical protein